MNDRQLMTTNGLARAAGICVGTVIRYANAGFIECERLANGTRLFKPDATEKVRKILRERIANRGRRAA